MSATPIILWAILSAALAIYWICLTYFESTLKKENFRLWESLVFQQVGALRIVRRAVFFTFLLNGDFQSLNNPRIARATSWVVVTGIISVLSGAAVLAYYNFYKK